MENLFNHTKRNHAPPLPEMRRWVRWEATLISWIRNPVFIAASDSVSKNTQVSSKIFFSRNRWRYNHTIKNSAQNMCTFTVTQGKWLEQSSYLFPTTPNSNPHCHLHPSGWSWGHLWYVNPHFLLQILRLNIGRFICIIFLTRYRWCCECQNKTGNKSLLL